METPEIAAVEKDVVVLYDKGLVNNGMIDIYNCFVIIKADTLTVHIISVI